jgi:hypothetical protein
MLHNTVQALFKVIKALALLSELMSGVSQTAA